MSDINPTTTALFSQSEIAYRLCDFAINVLKIDPNETESDSKRTYGKFVALVALTDPAKQRIDAEIQVNDAIDELIEMVNDHIDYVKKFDVVEVSLDDSAAVRVTDSLWIVTVEYRGETWLDADEYADDLTFEFTNQLALSL